MAKGIHAVIDFRLVYPYPQSADLLTQLCNMWSCKIITLSTMKSNAVIMMPWKKFKIIFGCQPRVGKFDAPENTEHFIEALEVKEIKVVV
jgi:hypothetical protein